MPKYMWKHCKMIYEEDRKIGDTEKICSICGEKASRVYSTPSISFKGTGWGKDGK